MLNFGGVYQPEFAANTGKLFRFQIFNTTVYNDSAFWPFFHYHLPLSNQWLALDAHKPIEALVESRDQPETSTWGDEICPQEVMRPTYPYRKVEVASHINTTVSTVKFWNIYKYIYIWNINPKHDPHKLPNAVLKKLSPEESHRKWKFTVNTSNIRWKHCMYKRNVQPWILMCSWTQKGARNRLTKQIEILHVSGATKSVGDKMLCQDILMKTGTAESYCR